MSSPPLHHAALLTFRQVAEALSLSTAMVYKLSREGNLPVVKLGTALRVHPDDLAAFVEARRGRRNGAAG